MNAQDNNDNNDNIDDKDNIDNTVTTATNTDDSQYEEALNSLRATLDKIHGCSDAEREQLRDDLKQLEQMADKLSTGLVEIVIFGEISTGKSALINAMIGEQLAAVDVQGGWTKEVWKTEWDGCGYSIPGFASSGVVIVDTPGLNEVGGVDRADMAREAASRADLILFVTDSDLNDTEFVALRALAESHKPIVVVLNKVDLYTPEQRERLMEVLRDERIAEFVPANHFVTTAADPREVEYVIESADGTTRNEWKKPPPKVDELKALILEVLEKDGLALLTLNAAMYAADKSDRISSLRVRLRNQQATKTIWGYAVLKSVAVAWNPVPIADVIGGGAVDVTMVVTLAKIYGLNMSWTHARDLIKSVFKAAGWMVGGYLAGEAVISIASSFFKGLTFGYGTVVTAVPQAAAAGYGSYIVGQAAKYYFEHGGSWGGESPKTVIRKILSETDKQSVLEHLKDEIKKKMQLNRHAD
jgi:small GTP-binding protein